MINPRSLRKRRLSRRDLQQLGARPGLMVRRISPEGRSSVEEIVTLVSGTKTTKVFVTRLETNAENG